MPNPPRRATRSALRTGTPLRARAVMAAVALGVFGPLSAALVATAPPASADPTIESDQAQISQIQAQVSADDARINTLSEQADEAGNRVAQDQTNIDAATKKLDQARQAESTTQGQLRQEAITAYIQGGNVVQINALVSGSTDDLAVRNYYVNNATNQEQATVSSLKAQQHTISQEQAALQAAKAADQADQNQVQASAAAARAEVASENQTLSQVKGNLASLYAQAEAQQRAQQQAAAQAAAAAAAAQQAQQNTGGGIATSGPGGVATIPGGLPPPPNPRAGVAVQYAEAQVGKPYIWGGTGPDGYDCSGLTMMAWAAAGVGLSHGSIAQYGETTRVSASELEPGDLVFYSPGGEPYLGHVAMYVGAGEVVAADNESQPIDVESMYYVGPPTAFGRVG